MASTYRSPETVVISEAGPAVKILDSFSNNFVKAASNIVKINNEKVKKTRAEQAALVKSIYIDPEKFLERLQKAGAEEQEYKLFNDLLDKNANMQLKIEAGLFDKSDYKYLMSEKNKTLTQLNSMVGLAADGTAKSVKYKENYLDNSKNLSRQGFQSALDNDYISAMNIYSGTNPTNAFETYFQGDTQMIKFSGKEFEKGEYIIPLKSLLAYEPMMVPEFNKEVTDLATGRLLEEDGSLTKVAKGMTEDDYLGEWSDIINTVTKGYAGNLSQIKSFALEVIGMEQDDIFSLDINTGIPGTEISDEALLKTMQTANKWAQDTMLIPKHIYEPPKPKELTPTQIKDFKKQKDFNAAVKSWEDKFIRTMKEFESAFNPEGKVMTGVLNIFNDVIDEDGKPAQELRPEFVRALSFLDGITVKSTNQDEARISGGGLTGDFTVIQGQPISIFVENLHRNIFGQNKSLYDTESAEKFAYQFDPKKGKNFNTGE